MLRPVRIEAGAHGPVIGQKLGEGKIEKRSRRVGEADAQRDPYLGLGHTPIVP